MKKLSKLEAYKLCLKMWQIIGKRKYNAKIFALEEMQKKGLITKELLHVLEYSSACFFCYVHRVSCDDCPFSEISALNHSPCLSELSPYNHWTKTGDTKPMVEFIKKALKELGK